MTRRLSRVFRGLGVVLGIFTICLNLVGGYALMAALMDLGIDVQGAFPGFLIHGFLVLYGVAMVLRFRCLRRFTFSGWGFTLLSLFASYRMTMGINNVLQTRGVDEVWWLILWSSPYWVIAVANVGIFWRTDTVNREMPSGGA